MQIIPLSEGAFTIDKSKVFIPFILNKDSLQDRNAGSLLVEVQPFVIITKNDVILIDTGLGFNYNNQLQIHQNLLAVGIPPERVTKVFLSHLHKDHAGGIAKKDARGNFNLSFENAVYYVQQNEYDFAMTNESLSYEPTELKVLENNPQVYWLNGNGYIDKNIEYQITAAHSQFHQVFWIKEDNDIIFFGGDDAPQIQQMKTKFVAKYDFNGKKCMLLRQQWWNEGREKNWSFLFYHDVKTPIYNESLSTK